MHYTGVQINFENKVLQSKIAKNNSSNSQKKIQLLTNPFISLGVSSHPHSDAEIMVINQPNF